MLDVPSNDPPTSFVRVHHRAAGHHVPEANMNTLSSQGKHIMKKLHSEIIMKHQERLTILT